MSMEVAQQRLLNAQTGIESLLAAFRESLLERLAKIEKKAKRNAGVLAEVRQLREQINARLR